MDHDCDISSKLEEELQITFNHPHQGTTKQMNAIVKPATCDRTRSLVDIQQVQHYCRNGEDEADVCAGGMEEDGTETRTTRR